MWKRSLVLAATVIPALSASASPLNEGSASRSRPVSVALYNVLNIRLGAQSAVILEVLDIAKRMSPTPVPSPAATRAADALTEFTGVIIAQGERIMAQGRIRAADAPMLAVAIEEFRSAYGEYADPAAAASLKTAEAVLGRHHKAVMDKAAELAGRLRAP